MTSHGWTKVTASLRLATCFGMAASALSATDLNVKWKTWMLVMLVFLTADSIGHARKAWQAGGTGE
jgi:hypothetical protein